MRLVYDLETDGLLDDLTTIHSAVLYDVEAKKLYSACDHAYETKRDNCEVIPLQQAIDMLEAADERIAHNSVRFDENVLRKLYPDRDWNSAKVYDTMLASQLVFADVGRKDGVNKARGKNTCPPGRHYGKYNLEAWGYRLGLWKGDYAKQAQEKGIDPWAEWNPPMQAYCEQDVAVTATLHYYLEKANYPQQAMNMEHRFLDLMYRRERFGFRVDVKGIEDLYARLAARRAELQEDLRTLFTPWYAGGQIVTPGKTINYKDPCRPDFTEGAVYQKVTYKEFDPGNRHHIADRLIKVHGWEPLDFNADGTPKTDESILAQLDFPGIEKLAEFLMVQKRIGQIAEGKKAWLRFIKDDRLHGAITTAGAVTRRCTHHDPNLSQVPATKVPYGKECRGVFLAEAEGMTALVGTDAQSLELRMLAHYMAPFDDGAYAHAVVYGREEDETDAHSLNAKALGLEPKRRYTINGKHTTGRDLAKRFIYAFLYGAGDYKIGLTVGVDESEIDELMQHPMWAKAPKNLKRMGVADTKMRRAMVVKGRILKDRFEAGMPALTKLRTALQNTLKSRDYIVTIDGARMPIRHKHAVLNTLLQSTGAILVKYATIRLEDELAAKGYQWGKDWAMVMHSHDEWQIVCRPEIADEIGETGCDAIKWAGVFLNLAAETDGAYKIGTSWAETH